MNCKGQPASFIVTCGNTSVSCADMLFLFCCQPHKSASRQDNALVTVSVLTQPPCNPHFLKLQARSHLFQALCYPATYQLLLLHWDDRQIPVPGFTLKPCLPWPNHSSGKSGDWVSLRTTTKRHSPEQVTLPGSWKQKVALEYHSGMAKHPFVGGGRHGNFLHRS